MVTAKEKAAVDKKKRERNGYIRIIGSYVLIAAILLGILSLRSGDVHDAQVLACKASLENRKLTAYVVSASQGNPDLMPDPSTLPPELRDLIEQARANNKEFLRLTQDALHEPLEICEKVNIDSRVDLPEIKPPTTTTTAPS